MGKRLAIVIGAAALGAAVMAAGASADFRSVHDPRGDTTCTHGHKVGRHFPCSDQRRDADIVRARAGHDGALLRHTVRVVGKVQSVSLLINTDSDAPCEWAFIARRGERSAKVRECSGPGTGRARIDFHRHSVEIFFSKRSIGNPQSYGWSAFAFAGSANAHAIDSVPNASRRRECFRPDAPPRCWIRQRLGDSGVGAAGVMALGAQTAAAAPDDTRVTISQITGLLHGDLYSAARKCEVGRRVVVFKQQPGTDRKLGVGDFGHGGPNHWDLLFPAGGKQGWHVYALVRREVRRHGLVCRSDRSRILTVK